MQSSKRIVAVRRGGARIRSRDIPGRSRTAAARALHPAPGAADSAPRASSPQRIAPRLQKVSSARLPTLRLRPAAMLRSMRIVSDGPNVNISPTMPTSRLSVPPAVALAKRDELLGVARVRHRKIGRQQIVLLAVRNLDPQRDAAQVRLVVRLAAAAGIGEPYDGRVGFAGRAKPARRSLWQVVDESQRRRRPRRRRALLWKARLMPAALLLFWS